MVERSNAVGQPTADRPYGGSSLPDQMPTRQNHTGRNIALAVGGVAVAGAAFSVVDKVATGNFPWESNSGQNNPGIIPPPIESAKPTVVIPSATPGATLEVTFPPATATPKVEPSPTPTPTPEPTEAPKPNNLASLLELNPTAVDRSLANGLITTAWNRIKELQDQGGDTFKQCLAKEDVPTLTLDYLLAKWTKAISASNAGDRQTSYFGLIKIMSLMNDPNNPNDIDPAIYPTDQYILFDARTKLPAGNLEVMNKDLNQLAIDLSKSHC